MYFLYSGSNTILIWLSPTVSVWKLWTCTIDWITNFLVNGLPWSLFMHQGKVPCNPLMPHSCGESNAQRCSFVRLRTELLAWTSKMNKQRYFTLCSVCTSIGWLPSARTSHAKKWDFFSSLYLYKCLYKYKRVPSFGRHTRIKLV